ncbi:tetratricopeptide repeat protein [Methanosarcina mazei]|uniref:Uncharacterized protein n=1 Tax=Methanosarcina mazei SarPi TaxID=1434115 RepID=A0A0E3R775_METMZ|nr:tetratricopeptide repeat protein [Methanosarcina mazei]AKB60845.1 hypothetical protein MSMAP_0860 [Methanosarcina mazei SarPi]
MGLFNFIKKKTDRDNELPKPSLKPQYSISGHFLYMGDFSGQFHQSPNGRFILAWKDQYDKGSYILLDNGKIKLRTNMTRPNDGSISNSGVFVINDWTSQNMSGIFNIISPDGESLVKKRFKANLYNSGISEDGLFAVCQTARSDEESDSNKLCFFDVINRKLLWKKSPDTGWAKSYLFDTDNKILYLIYDGNRTYRYTFDGDCIDLESFMSYRIYIGGDTEFLKAADEWKEKLTAKNAAASEYDALIVSLNNGLKKFCSPCTQSKIHKLLGECHLLQGNNSETIEHFEIALKINPNIGVKGRIEKLKKKYKL